MSTYVGSIEAGGTTFVVGIISLSKPDTIIEKAEYETTVPEETLTNCINWLKDHDKKNKLVGIGIACFGPLNLNKKSENYGSITITPKKNWRNFNILKKVQESFPDIPCNIDTDVNAAATAEIYSGLHPINETGSLAYVTVGTGIGVGIVAEGKCIHGSLHPEMGHIYVPRAEGDDFVGNCPSHKNCIEGLAASNAIAARKNLVKTELAQIDDNDVVWDYEAHYLAHLCVTLTLTVSPDIIVLGGGIMKRKVLFDKIRSKVLLLLNNYIQLDSIINHIDSYIVYSPLGENSGLFGGFSLIKSVIPDNVNINNNNDNNNNNNFDDEEEKEKPIFFTDKSIKKVPLIEKIEISHDTRLFRFGLPTDDTVLGLPVGKHFKLYCPNPKPSQEGMWNNHEDKEAQKDIIERKYTPTSSDDELGILDLVIKVYKGGEEPFVDGGKMSQYLDNLKIGDEIDIKGTFGLLEYNGNGQFTIMRKKKSKTKVGMIAGGTGVTPMYQIIQAILKNSEDKTELSLLFANKTDKDILLRKELESLQEQNPDQFKLYYTLDNPPEDWDHFSGFVTKEMIDQTMPTPDDDSIILLCGPPLMIKFLKPNLKEYKDIFSF